MAISEIDKYLKTVTFTQAVVGYLVRKDEVCLGVRKKVSADLGKDLIAGIGGKVGDETEFANETPDEAMDREAREEIKIKVKKKKQLGRVRFIFTHKPSDSKWNQDVLVYQITEWKGVPQETDSTKPVWFDKDKIPWGKMWEDNEKWMPKTLLGQVVNAVFLFSGDNTLKEFRFESD